MRCSEDAEEPAFHFSLWRSGWSVHVFSFPGLRAPTTHANTGKIFKCQVVSVDFSGSRCRMLEPGRLPHFAGARVGQASENRNRA